MTARRVTADPTEAARTSVGVATAVAGADGVLDRPLGEALRDPSGRIPSWVAKDDLVGKLAKAYDIHTVGDLLAHLPRRLQDRADLTDLGGLREGDDITIIAEVESVSTRRMRQRQGQITEVRIGDGRHHLTLTWFKAPWIAKQLHPGRRGIFTGKVRMYKGAPQLAFPAFGMVDDDIAADGTIDLRGASARARTQLARPLIPFYSTTGKLTTWTIAAAVDHCLDLVEHEAAPDTLTADERAALKLADQLSAWRLVHQPSTRSEFYRGRARLAFDEALDIQLVLARRRHAARAEPGTPRPPRRDGLLEALDARLPFALTAGQLEVGEVVAGELTGELPMQRLLQGEVGSGKTVVALRAMAQVVDAGGQAVLLAPTEVLAAQHARSLATLLGPLAEAGRLGGSDIATRIALITGSLGAKARRAALLDVASGAAGIVVGTHALLEERVQFADLGLVVVDEQHRFGVEQRDALRGRAQRPPHLLVMTATPIPRTVAMTVFGDLEVSTLRERPAGRAEVSTVVVPAGKEAWLDRVWSRVREEVAAGRQVFVVCPRIGGDEPDDDIEAPGDGPTPSEDPFGDEPLSHGGAADQPTSARRPAAAVLDVAPLLAAGPLESTRLGILHGRLPAEEKDTVMTAFAVGELDVLVATTVIEVGVDIPNASAMVVLDADRFGISQLHQLRGRIGRGALPGVCLLVSEADEGTPARARLEAVAASNDGFALAEADLAQRREGDVLGAAQSGTRRSLRLLSLLRDRDVIAAARDLATAMVDADPDLVNHQPLRRRVGRLEAEDRSEFLDKS